MKKILIKDTDFKIKDRNVACIGYFDSVHLGHQDLINKTVSEAERLKTKSALICFRPDPADIILGKKNKHIFSDKEKENIIRDLGIDMMIIISFDEQLMKIEAIEFIEKYLNRMNIEELVSGFDFSFGYKGSGNNKLLKKYGNFKNIIIPEHTHYGKKVSSSRIKDELNKANLKLVDKLLGYPYYRNLKVINVAQNGSKWLIEAIQNEKDIIDIKDGNYDRFSLENGIYTFESDIPYKENDVIKLYVNKQ